MSNVIQVIDGTLTVVVDGVYAGSVEMSDYGTDYNSAVVAATDKANQAKTDYDSMNT